MTQINTGEPIDDTCLKLKSYSYFRRRCFRLVDDKSIFLLKGDSCRGASSTGFYSKPLLTFARHCVPITGLYAKGGRIYFFCGEKVFDVSGPDVTAFVLRRVNA